MNSALDSVSAAISPPAICAAWAALKSATYWLKATTRASLLTAWGGVNRPVPLMTTLYIVNPSACALWQLKFKQLFVRIIHQSRRKNPGHAPQSAL
ncbi:hypothetical protein D3C85_1033750 [compost metagenome]